MSGCTYFVQVEPEALTLLCSTAMVDIAHLLRPKHLRQLASILEDPEVRVAPTFVDPARLSLPLPPVDEILSKF